MSKASNHVAILAIRVPSVTLVSRYRNSKTLTLYQCNICRHRFKRTPSNMYAALSSCPKCAGGKGKRPEEHVKDVYRIWGKRLKVLGVYKSSKTEIEYECVCGTLFFRRPDSILSRMYPCPKCSIDSTRVAYDLEVFRQFRYEVTRRTEENYARYKRIINPSRKVRARFGYHLDHMYSVWEAFCNPKELIHPITIKEVSHPANLTILSQSDNNIKKNKSSITASELRRRINEFERNQVNNLSKNKRSYGNGIQRMATAI